MPSVVRSALVLIYLTSDASALRKVTKSEIPTVSEILTESDIIAENDIVGESEVATESDVATESNMTQESASGGMVHGLYTFGAPGPSTVPLKNGRASNGCFPGERSWNTDGSKVDAVAMITVPLGYKHANYNAVQEDKNGATRFSCSSNPTGKPFGIPNIPLHEEAISFERLKRRHSSGLIHDIAIVGVGNSYVWNYNQMYNNLAGTGWELRSLAYHNGGVYGVGGAQVSHVLRKGSDCILTFQGTKTDGDWQANFQISRARFCGLEGRVHLGFRDHLMRMVSSNDFQSYTKPELARCSRVYVAGHSLGGAMSELFTACANRGSAPSSREDPDGHYRLISFR